MPQAAPPIADSGDPVTEIARLRAEICLMSERIEDTKREISAIRPKDTDNDRLAIVTNELDAIVDATERATQGILESAETVDDLARKLHARAEDQETVQDIEAIQNAVVRIFEESNFQDITGQRISKVVKTLQFIEDRLNRMIDIWGHDSLAEAPVAPVEDIAVDEDSKLLNGPALGDQGISQADIDKLFD
ncbi:MAG: protein phosphatase CheZ, partial [Rhodospirillaceae bacterium]|nr:protein phosphatase CheZ [Rhodospirillaceae bacterium]